MVATCVCAAMAVVMTTPALFPPPFFFRYHPHQKLVGFMAPLEVGTMADRARSVYKCATMLHACCVCVCIVCVCMYCVCVCIVCVCVCVCERERERESVCVFEGE